MPETMADSARVSLSKAIVSTYLGEAYKDILSNRLVYRIPLGDSVILWLSYKYPLDFVSLCDTAALRDTVLPSSALVLDYLTSSC